MAKDVIMPALGMAQETGALLQWLKAPGEAVTKGEPLMEIETDKATVEVEAPASGVLANVTARPGDVVPVGQIMAVILAPGETAGDAKRGTAERGRSGPERPAPGGGLPSADEVARRGQRPAEEQKREEPVASAVIASPVAARLAAEHNVDLTQVRSQGGRVQKADVLAYLETRTNGGQQPAVSGRILASPKARRLAREQGLDLAMITGSGPEGAVLAADVEEVKRREATVKEIPALQPSSLPTPQPSALPVSRMWQVMAQRLTESWTTIPHFYLAVEANAAGLIQWRERVLQRATEKITFTDLLVKLVAVALRRHPRLNAQWDNNNTIVLNEAINVGLAVAVEEGLLVPVIHEADRLGLNDIARRRQELVSKAQNGKLSLDDLSGGTFTISNLGMYGVDAFNAIVNPPQAAILALGRIAERVVPVNGQPAVQPMLTMTLSCDHRVVDGARGAQFLQTLAELVAEPMRLLD